MSERRFCTVRFNLEKPEHRKAWMYLQNINRREFKSYSAAIIAALNKFFDKTDSDFADMLVKRIAKELQNNLVEPKSDEAEKISSDEENIAWDFLGDGINNIED